MDKKELDKQDSTVFSHNADPFHIMLIHFKSHMYVTFL